MRRSRKDTIFSDITDCDIIRDFHKKNPLWTYGSHHFNLQIV